MSFFHACMRYGAAILFVIAGIQLVLGIFLVRASRAPFDHLSLIWFTVWSSLMHAVVMAAHAAMDHREQVHLIGDVPALVIPAMTLAVLTLTARQRPSSG